MCFYVRYILKFPPKMYKSRKDPLPKIETASLGELQRGGTAIKLQEAGRYAELHGLELPLKTV